MDARNKWGIWVEKCRGKERFVVLTAINNNVLVEYDDLSVTPRSSSCFSGVRQLDEQEKDGRIAFI
jgi:hypothetical protein